MVPHVVTVFTQLGLAYALTSPATPCHIKHALKVCTELGDPLYWEIEEQAFAIVQGPAEAVTRMQELRRVASDNGSYIIAAFLLIATLDEMAQTQEIIDRQIIERN